MQPRADVRARFKPIELPVSAKKCFLDDIFSILNTTGDAIRDTEHGAAVALHERLKRIGIPRTRANEERRGGIVLRSRRSDQFRPLGVGARHL